MTEVVKAESLPRFQPDANLNRGGANFVCGHHAGTQRCSALHLFGGENPVVRLCIESISMPTSEGIGQYVSQRDRAADPSLFILQFAFLNALSPWRELPPR